MLSKITETEQTLDALLPVRRLEHSPFAEMLAAAHSWSDAVWAAAAALGPMPLSAEQLSSGRRLAKCPVLICGVHRSGTTLARDLLDAHPDMVVLPAEGTYYTVLERKLKAVPANEQAKFLGTEWLRRLANPINQPPYWLLGRSTGTTSPYVDFARYLLAWWQATDKEIASWPQQAIILAYASCTGRLEARYWVDKTPLNERFIGRAWQEMPTAKIIHIIREPVATLTSRKIMEPGLSMRSALRDMEVSFRLAVKQPALNDRRFMLLRYEELSEDPQRVIKALASFLGIEVLPILSQPTVAGMPSRANSSFNKEAAPGQILKQTEHLRAEVLNAAELELIASHIGRLSGMLNYPLAQGNRFKGFYLKLKNGLI